MGPLRRHMYVSSSLKMGAACPSLRNACKGKKVKCTIIQALRFCTGRTAHRGSRGIALPFLDHGSEGVRGQRHTPEALYPQGRLGTHFTGGWVGPRGIRSPDRPARSQSLYRLRYPAHEMLVIVYKTTRWHTSRITLNILPHRW